MMFVDCCVWWRVFIFMWLWLDAERSCILMRRILTRPTSDNVRRQVGAVHWVIVLSRWACFLYEVKGTSECSELCSHGTGTLRCLQKEMATYRHWSVSLWRDPDDVSHCRILSPDETEWRLISATLCGWRRCFMADQLWLMTCIREEEECSEVLNFSYKLAVSVMT